MVQDIISDSRTFLNNWKKIGIRTNFLGWTFVTYLEDFSLSIKIVHDLKIEYAILEKFLVTESLTFCY